MSPGVERTNRTTLTRETGYRFRVRFDLDGMPDLITDESPPLGEGKGPSPSRLLATAVANCLAASLLFCLEKARVPLKALEAEVVTEFTRNEAGRLRIDRFKVRLNPRWTPEAAQRAQRCLSIFEDFCLVTQAVRHGTPVEVEIAGLPAAIDPGGST